MLKRLLLLVFWAFFTPLPFALLAQNSLPLLESFEKGLPNEWSIEYDTPNSQLKLSWSVEKATTALSSDAIDGSYIIVYKNTVGVQQQSRTRLISPIFDPTGISNPVLCYSYYAPRSNGRFDTLCIKYRNLDDKDAKWITLYRTTKHANAWQSDTIQLVSWSARYQLAFEAVDNLGGGIFVDNIQVRELPQCVTPHSLTTSDITASSAKLTWGAGFSQDYFHLKVSSYQLKQFELEDPNSKADMLDSLIDGSSTEFIMENLGPGTRCYWYLSTICGVDKTDWVSGMEFSIPNQIKVPFTEDFNVKNVNNRAHIDNWYWANSFGGDAPFVNAHQTDWLEDASDDGTYALVFGVDDGGGVQGDYNSIPADEWAYIATPEILVDDISLLQISFNASTVTWNNNSGKILVGIMTDPTDLSTFTQVEEVAVPIKDKEFAVSFTSYEGEGKYIALLSKFAQTNLVALDNINVKFSPACPKVKRSSQIFPSAQSFVFDWVSSASSGDIVISNSRNLKPNVLDTIQTTVIRVNNAPKGCLIDNSNKSGLSLNPGKTYYTYVRSVCGQTEKSDWSDAMLVTLPDTLSSVPKQNIHTVTKGNFQVLPEIVGLDIKDLEIKFNATSNVMVGILDTLGSESSFTLVEQSGGNNPIRKVNFANYQGKGRFIALVGEASDIKLGYISTCDDPSELQSIPADTFATLTWTAPVGAQYEVRVAMSDIYSVLNTDQLSDYVFVDTVTAPSVTVNHLQPSNTKYYWWVRSVCRDIDEASKLAYSDWSQTATFATLCPAVTELPYVLDLSKITGKLTDHCFNVKEFNSYPQINNYIWNVPGHTAALEMRTYASNPSSTDIYMIFNPMEVDKVSDLLMSFKTYNATSPYSLSPNYPIEKQHIEVGVMTEPDDFESFTLVQRIAATEISTLETQEIDFSDYDGNGKYIAVRALRAEDTYMQLFDIRIDRNPGCVQVATPMVSQITANTAKLSWRKSTDSKWQIVLAQGRLSNNNLDEAIAKKDGPFPSSVGGVDIAYVNADVSQNTNFQISGLSSSTKYYAYIRAICDANIYSTWSNPAMFSTPCPAFTSDELGVIDFEVAQYTECETRPDCWVMINTIDNNKWSPVITNEMAHSGLYSLKVASEISQLDISATYAIMPELNVTDISEYRMTFYASCGVMDYDKLSYWNRCQLPEMPRAEKIIVGVTSSTLDLSRIRTIDTIRVFENWQPFTVSFEDYVGDDYAKGANVVFISEFDKNNVVYIDDIEFEKVGKGTCCSPLDVTLTEENSEDSIKFKWRSGNAPYVMKIANRQLSENELTIPDIKNVMTISDINYQSQSVGGLKSQSYYVYVGSTCDNQILWSQPYHYMPECPVAQSLPYTENFDNYTPRQGLVPNCWEGFYRVSNSEINRYPHIIDKGKQNNGLYVYTLGNTVMSYAILPKVDANITECQISFDAAADKNMQRSVIVGVATELVSADDIHSKFIPVDTIILKNNEYQRFTVSLASTTPSAKHIVLSASYDDNWYEAYSRLGGAGGAYIDNVTVSAIGDCQAPTSVDVEIYADNKALLLIKGETSEYALMKGDVGFTPNSSNYEKIANSHELVIGEVPFEIYVASYCNGTVGTEFYGPIVISPITSITDASAGVIDNFDEPAKWTLLNEGQYNKWVISTPENGASECLFISSNNIANDFNSDVASNVWAYRTFDVKPGLYTVSFDVKVSDITENNFFQIGLLPVGSTFESGSAQVMGADGVITSIGYNTLPSHWLNLAQNVSPSTEFVTLSTEFVVTNSDAGLYNFVLYWNNTNVGSGLKSSVAVDNLNVLYQACVAPYDLFVDDITNNSATLSWTQIAVEGLSVLGFDVFVTDDIETASPDDANLDAFRLLKQDEKESKATITALPGGADLVAFVRTHCTADGYSDWSLPIHFSTLCDPFDTLGLIFNFDEESALVPLEIPKYAWQSPSVFLPKCFLAGHMYGEDINSAAPVVHVEDGYDISRSRPNALSFNGINGVKDKMAGGFIALPALNADYENMQLVFWMRAVAVSSYSKEFYMPNSVLDPKENDAAITVGVMSDPNDVASFEKISVCRYPYSNIDITSATRLSDDPSGNDYWVKYIVPLKNTKGKYITFLNEGYGAKANKIFIDDVKIEPYAACLQPQEVKIIKVTSDSVLFTFNHDVGNAWFAEVSELKNMTNVVASKTSDSDTMSISGLKENTTYYLTIKQVCEENSYSDPSMLVSFTTSHGLRYEETFSEKDRTPKGWLRTNGSISIDDLINNTSNSIISNINMNHPDGWKHTPVNEYMSAHQILSVNGYAMSSTGCYWMLTPTIYVREGENANITFDLAVSQSGSMETLLEGDLKSLNTFVLAVSEDNGRTFSQENMFIWNNESQGDNIFRFADLTNTFKRFTIDISKFMDKNICMAFSAFGRTDNVDFDIHIDNVVVNTMTVVDINETLCGLEDYVEYGFDIPYETIQNADGNIYKCERYDLSSSDEPDVLYRLSLSALPVKQCTDIVSVCESQLPYTDSNGFYITQSGLYSKRIDRVGECDSIYTVDLRVMSTITTLESVQICRGSQYDFNGQVLNVAGVYSDTLVAVSTGCDSIVVLRLEVLPAAEYNDTVIICFGQTYVFNGKELSDSGDYTETFTQGECDSIVHLHLEILPEYIDIKNVAICEGEVYNDDVFKGLKSNFSDTLLRRSSFDCDSLVGLELVVIGNDEVIEIEKNITRDDLPYTYFGHTFDEETKDGTTVQDILIKSQSGICEGIIRLTLNVEKKTYPEDGIGYNILSDLKMTPNPVSKGSILTIEIDVNDIDFSDVKIEVLNTSGIKVKSEFMSGKRHSLVCDFMIGMYIIRLSIDDVVIGYDKIIVF